jgi:hypothetical protein
MTTATYATSAETFETYIATYVYSPCNIYNTQIKALATYV